MKVRASVKRSPECKIVEEKEIVRNKQKNLDLNKDKDNYGKNSRVDIPKIREVLLHLPISLD
jgi:ribosomal protein L36